MINYLSLKFNLQEFSVDSFYYMLISKERKVKDVGPSAVKSHPYTDWYIDCINQCESDDESVTKLQ